MKQLFFFTFILIAFLSCKTTQSNADTSKTAKAITPSNEKEQIELTVYDKPVPSYVDEEYARSVNTVNVSKATFTEDKAEIMSIINQLEQVLQKYDYTTWKTFIDQESIAYWSSPKNLSKASGKLPVKGLKMTSLKDYFTHVFVPSRRGRKVDEIRYTSETDVKAVQVNNDTDIIYYYFNKINNKWYVTLPQL